MRMPMMQNDAHVEVEGIHGATEDEGDDRQDADVHACCAKVTP